MQIEIKIEWVYGQSSNEIWEYLTQPELKFSDFPSNVLDVVRNSQFFGVENYFRS